MQKTRQMAYWLWQKSLAALKPNSGWDRSACLHVLHGFVRVSKGKKGCSHLAQQPKGLLSFPFSGQKERRANKLALWLVTARPLVCCCYVA